MSSPRLNLVVAACNNNGIGKNGSLPWSLRKDMDFFKKITSQTADPDKKNAVIMGRKTWFSIPEKFRPLKGRVNVVLSRELKEVPEGVYISRSLPDAVNLLTTDPLRDQIENIHVIGGSSVYQEAMNSCNCRLYLTRILADFDCDTYLPEINQNVFKKNENPPNVPTDLQEEKDIKFRFEVYDKIQELEMEHSQLSKERNQHCGTNTEPAFRMEHADEQVETPDKAASVNKTVTPDKVVSINGMDVVNIPAENETVMTDRVDKTSTHGPIKFCIMSAMCHNNRGIAKDMKLPWPPLRRDYEYYTTMTSSPRNKELNGKIIHIRGRHTWECCQEKERSLPNVYHLVVSSSLRDVSHPRLLKIVSSFEEAVSLCNIKPLCDEIDSIWVMGGSSIYKPALNHQLCDKLYLTHIYQDFPADTFFPEFEDYFQEISDGDEEKTILEDNGIEYAFHVYQKI